MIPLRHTAIVCLATVESVAIIMHEDGAYLSLVVAAISAIVGYSIGKKRKCEAD